MIHICREKGLEGGKKKLKETGKTCKRPGQGRKRTFRTKIERQTFDENGTLFPKKSCVPHA